MSVREQLSLLEKIYLFSKSLNCKKKKIETKIFLSFISTFQNLDRFGFVDALNKKYRPFGWIFEQDGAPAHISRLALEWLEESVDVVVDWPPNSPDLSPIKLLCAISKKSVSRINPRTIHQLKSALLAAWTLIPQNSINKLCTGFPPAWSFV
jgi:hypothetical protein